jgi:hypothetical protein
MKEYQQFAGKDKGAGEMTVGIGDLREDGGLELRSIAQRTAPVPDISIIREPYF